jgi:hypothetical protein
MGFLDIIHCSDFLKRDVSETGLCLHLKVKPALLGQIGRVSPYLRTPAVIPVKAYRLSRMTYTGWR